MSYCTKVDIYNKLKCELKRYNENKRRILNNCTNEIDIKSQSNIPENLLVRLGQINVDLKNSDLTNENLVKYEKFELPLYKREKIKEDINEIIKLSESNIDKIENYDDIVEKNGSLFS